jgi:hypothetical protein
MWLMNWLTVAYKVLFQWSASLFHTTVVIMVKIWLYHTCYLFLLITRWQKLILYLASTISDFSLFLYFSSLFCFDWIKSFTHVKATWILGVDNISERTNRSLVLRHSFSSVFTLSLRELYFALQRLIQYSSV